MSSSIEPICILLRVMQKCQRLKACTKHTCLGSYQWNKTFIPHILKFKPMLLSFSWRIFSLKNVDVYTFGRGGGDEKVYCMYTRLIIDNSGWLKN